MVAEAYKDVSEFLASLSDSGLVREPERSTVFSVSGFPRRELVASRMLQFFLNESEHGLEDLWFRSFVEALKLGNPSLENHDFGALEEVRTEEYANGLSIDLVLETETTVIGIENKIDAGLYNNLEAYLEHLQGLAKSDSTEDQASELEPRESMLVVLSPREFDVSAPVGRGCFSLLYEALFARVQLNLGSYLDGADLHWLAIMRDFIENISRMTRVDGMGNDRVQFIAQNYDELEKLEKVLSGYKDWAEKALESILEKFSERFLSFEDKPERPSLVLGLRSTKITKPRSAMQLYVRGYVYLEFDKERWPNTVIGKHYAKSGLKLPESLVVEMWLDSSGLHVALIDQQNKRSGVDRILGDFLTEEGKHFDWFIPGQSSEFFGRKLYEHLHTVASTRLEDDDDEKVEAVFKAVDFYRHLLRPA